MNKYVLAFDPSGNFNEGKGTTGWCLLDVEKCEIIKLGLIYSGDYKSEYQYWDAHLQLIDSFAGYLPIVVIEDYLLYHNHAASQINSRFETSKLIGILQYECFKRGMFTKLQTAVTVKARWSDNILVHKGILTRKGNRLYFKNYVVPEHIRDAIRHAVHHATFGKEEKKYVR